MYQGSSTRSINLFIGRAYAYSNTYLPTQQGWQVDAFTGSVGYDVPITVTAGPGGIHPTLALHYDSGATDGPSGLQPHQQAGWVGKGWTLDTGSVDLRRVAPPSAGILPYYTLALNGHGFDLARGAELSGYTDPTDTDPTHWQWSTTDEAFLRVLPVSNGSSYDSGDPTTSRGGLSYGVPLPRASWLVWTKDGTKYEFSEDLWWGFDACDTTQYDPVEAWIEPYKWQLHRVTDTHGNAITYTYGRASQQPVATTCGGVQGTVDQDSWPTSVTWGANAAAGTADHFQVQFFSSPRENDTIGDEGSAPYGGTPDAVHQTRRLDQIGVYSLPDGQSPLLIRAYRLGHDYSLSSDASFGFPHGPDPTSAKLTLTTVTRLGNDGANYVPPTTFTYGADRGGNFYPNGAWNRLTGVDNGQGGTLAFAYDEIGAVTQNASFLNYRRVTSRTVTDTITGTSGTWGYTYGTPEVNMFGGRTLQGMAETPNSAALYLGAYYSPRSGAIAQPAHPQYSEFRGHSSMTETAPNGTQTQHFFFQGDTADQQQPGCIPTASGSDLATFEADFCFVLLRTNEFLRGHEYRTLVTGPANAGSPPYSDVTRAFTIPPTWSYGQEPRAGLWNHYVYTSAETATTAEPGSTPGSLTRATTYHHDGFGNLDTTTEYPDGNTAGTPYRVIHRQYATLNTLDAAGTGSYLLDRLTAVHLFDGGGNEQARESIAYDHLGGGGLAATGDVTQTSAFFDLAGSQSSDQTFGYDAYGNRTTVTTFTGPNATGSARTTTTAYDPVFHDLPVRVTAPLPALVEQATYDPVMRTLVSATDANGATTTATYDRFGQLATLVKPGDTAALPTLQATINYWGRPFHAWTAQRETSGQGLVHYRQRFWDGLGRPLQTKDESQQGSINTVTDVAYDALGNPAQASQPRAVAVQPSPDDFFLSTPLDPPNERWTTTAYDALNRPTVVTAPDGTTTRAAYALTASGPVVTAIDANGHRTDQTSDLFGRLATVTEFSGNGGSEGGYTPYATTQYASSPLDLLTSVTDAQQNVTTLTYDALGRKLTARDPDLGSWAYQYDATGNLTQQTDAKSQITGFGYDALDRLIQTTGATTARYGYDQGTNGLGHRTSATNSAATLTTAYDSRGRTTSATENVAGQAGTWTTSWAYNDADKVTSITYPVTSEVVSYGYDAAWRATSLCPPAPNPVPPGRNDVGPAPTPRPGPVIPCYASNATYTALDQPTQLSLGNGLLEQWGYTSPLPRLNRLQIGTSAQSPSTVYDRGYSYDPKGNVTQISNNLQTVDQRFSYDARDRLTHACTASRVPGSPCPDDETDSYDQTGNLTSKNGVPYLYTSGDTSSGHAHAPASVGGGAYTYDANGNTLTGGGRSYTWNGLNQPTSISGAGGAPPPGGGTPNLVAPSRGGATVAGTPNNAAPNRGGPTVAGSPANAAAGRPTATGGGTETYSYDADGNRVTKTANGITTVYIGGIFEQDVPSGVTRSQYLFNGHIIAQKTVAGGSSTVVYLHGDHLGSVSVATSATGAVLDQQEYGLWGTIRSGGVSETTLNYTGQKRDGTGLLYYGARYYDPALGRFLSPDSIGVNAGNPQSLNRYSYVGNNPLNHTDPTGHCTDDAGCNDSYGNPGGEPTGLDNGGGGGDPSGGGGGDPGRGGNDSGGNGNSGDPTTSGGGAAAFADLVQTIDQIPVASDPAEAVAIASVVASVDPTDSGGLVNYILETTFGFGTADLVGNGGFRSFETDTQGTGTTTTAGRLGNALAGLAGALALICEAGGCNGTDSNSSGIGNGTGIGTNSPERRPHVIIISETLFPEIAQHIRDTQSAGQPSILTYDSDPSNARRRRSDAQRGVPAIPNFQRDEYPFASTFEGGAGASVRYVDPGQNMGAGGSYGVQIQAQHIQTGDKFAVIIGP